MEHRLVYESGCSVYEIRYQRQGSDYQITGVYNEDIDNNILGDLKEYLPGLLESMKKEVAKEIAQ